MFALTNEGSYFIAIQNGKTSSFITVLYNKIFVICLPGGWNCLDRNSGAGKTRPLEKIESVNQILQLIKNGLVR
jgi:hypothetical protein